MIEEVPPLLIRGSGCPVTGARPVATIILKRACTTMSSANPIARKAGNGFAQRRAMYPVLKRRDKYSKATKAAPSNPNSSKIIA